MGRKKSSDVACKTKNPMLKEIIARISGEHGNTVVTALMNKEMTDEELAKRTDIRVNLVRRILYDLYENRVVNYRRMRDENSGWYIYYWRLEPNRALEHFNSNKQHMLKKLEDRLDQERNTMFFSCNNGCPRQPFDLATETDFKCPHCGNRLEYVDNNQVITTLERQIAQLRQNC